jgi:hypothetical protein
VVPYVVVLGVWQLAYRALGYGAVNTGLYTDPLGDPLTFALTVLQRAPVLLAAELTLPVAEAVTAFPAALSAVLFASILVLALFTWLFASSLARDRTARWYALGALFALVPACATLVHGRMGFFPSIGAAALVAMFVDRALSATSRSWPISTVAVLLLARNTLLASAILPFSAASPRRFGAILRVSMSSLPDDAPLAHQTLVIVNTPHIFVSNFVGVFRREDGRFGAVAPAKIRTLGETTQALRVTRVDPYSLELSVADGYLGAPLYQIAWAPGDRRPAGFTVELGDSRYEVVEATPDGRPRTVRVRFAEPLESPRYRWVAWRGERFADFTPPSLGGSVTLPAIDLLDAIVKLE